MANALMAEIAIGEAHAGDRALKAAVVLPDQIEAGLERNALQRCADGLPAHLQRIAGKPDVARRPGARELDRSGGAAVLENAARAARAIEAPERKNLSRDKPAGFVRIHLPGQRRHRNRSRDHSQRGSQHKTHKHAQLQPGGGMSLPAAYHTNRGNYWSRLVGKV